MKKRFSFYLRSKIICFILILSFLSYSAAGKERGKKNYNYFIKRGGIFRYSVEGGTGSPEESYVLVGMTKSDIIKLNDVKCLYSLYLDFDGERIKYIWVDTVDIKTPAGTGVGNTIEPFRKYQPVKIEGAREAYTPPYSGVVFISNTERELIDRILICSTSISKNIYRAFPCQHSLYVTQANGKKVASLMDEIIGRLYKSLSMAPCIIQDIIVLPSRYELGDIYSLYGGTWRNPVTSFCVNEPSGSVIYILDADDDYIKGILAHEYAHAWHYNLLGKIEMDPVISEGFAEWVRYHYQGKSFMARSEKDYIKGLELFLAVEKEKGTEGVFKYLLNHSWKPEKILPLDKIK